MIGSSLGECYQWLGKIGLHREVAWESSLLDAISPVSLCAAIAGSGSWRVEATELIKEEWKTHLRQLYRSIINLNIKVGLLGKNNCRNYKLMKSRKKLVAASELSI